ncbi:MAG: DinB family protein [Rhodoferax sp.]|uniref:DinB family protein n=1 Tax=Rhodoferax sp. TaxID=50421 RepID=UPI0032647F2D
MLAEAFQYKQWADRRALDAVSRIDAQQFPAGYAFALQQFNHMVRVEELFKARLLGAPVPHLSTNTEVVPDLPALSQRMEASNQWFASYVDHLTPGEKRRTVSFEFVDGKHGSMACLEILFHIVNHGSYHRGAIGHALDLAQVAHPADTYTVFIHATQPARREPG